MMAAIFSGANQVLLWMGEEDDDTSEVFHLFTVLGRRHQAELKPDTRRDTVSLEGKNEEDEWFKKHEFDGFSKVQAFTDRTWFQRAWTFQEACVSGDCFIVCGKLRLHWRIFVSAVLYLTSQGMLDTFGKNADTIAALASFSVANPSRQTPYLSTILPLTRGLQATDARDKVFSFIGMVENENLPPLVPSYTQSVGEVYTHATRAMIVQEGGLSALSGVHGVGRQNQDLPSWVPDWRRPRPTAYLHGFDWPSPTHLYNINKGAPFSNKLELSPTPELGTLLLRGAQIDSIKRVCKPNELLAHIEKLHTKSSTELKYWQEDLRRITETVCKELNWKLGSYKQTGEDCVKALMRTLTADRGGVGEKGMGRWKTSWGLSSSTRVPKGVAWKKTEGGEIDDTVEMKMMATAMWTFLRERTIFVTKNGLVGIGGAMVQPGDMVWNIVGGEVPFVLRSGSWWPFGELFRDRKELGVVGEAYVHGIMKGELWAESSEPQSPLRIGGGGLVFEDVELV